MMETEVSQSSKKIFVRPSKTFFHSFSASKRPLLLLTSYHLFRSALIYDYDIKFSHVLIVRYLMGRNGGDLVFELVYFVAFRWFSLLLIFFNENLSYILGMYSVD